MSAIVKQAQALIARRNEASSGCAVLWQRTEENAAAFAQHVRTARQRLPDNRLLVVVCQPNAVPRSAGVCVIEIPFVMLPLFDRVARYRACYGGRGAGRSWSFARALIAKSLEVRVRILCAREFKNSIQDSILTLLSDQIQALGLGQHFEVQSQAIYGRNGSEFIFSGIRSNPTRIKSLENAGICFIEEAAQISARSWEILVPTIRAAGSAIWAAYNPDLEDDPTHQKFAVHPPDSAVVLKTTYADNPYFPATLRLEMEWLKVHDPDAHAHVWLGECRSASDAQIFRGKYVVESFTVPPGADGPYFGLDLGFAADPSVLTKCWVHDSKLYVEAEAWQLHCDIDKLPDLLRQIPDSHKYTIRCDSARPEAVSYLRAHGFPGVVSVDKWPDSIADGIARMRAFEKILLHSSCEHTALEFRLYAHKTDRLTGDVLPDIIDRHNDCCDSLRYALAPLIKGSGPGALLAWMAQDAAAQKTQATALRDRPGVIVRDLTSGG